MLQEESFERDPTLHQLSTLGEMMAMSKIKMKMETKINALSALLLSAVFCNFDNLCSLLFLPDEWKHESSASNKQYVASCLAFSY